MMMPIAPITIKATNKIRFQVDNVEPATQRLPVKNAKLQLENYLEKPLLAFSYNDDLSLITNYRIHPLVEAVHLAFSEHRPLTLTPDIIWITIAQGFAQHINNNAEKLRSYFVNHKGKKSLIVDTLQTPTLPQQWNDIIQQWTLKIRDQVGADIYRLLECNFSTTTPISHTVSHIVMMDTFKKYFDYECMCVCGIPEITLEGTVEDWTSIYQRVQSMAKYDLEWWTDKLLPICQEFINTASGQPNLKFWQAIYKPQEIYAADEITGWLGVLFPYLKSSNLTETASRRNPMLEMDEQKFLLRNGISAESCFFLKVRNKSQISEICMLALLSLLKEGNNIGILLLWLIFLEKTYVPDQFRISYNLIPLGISQVSCKIEIHNNNHSFALVGGFIGVSQAEDGTLKPEMGWGVIEKEDDPFAELLDKIEQEHITENPINWDNFDWIDIESIFLTSKEVFQMLDRFNGAILYANSNHSWQISKCDKSSKSYKICPNLFPELHDKSHLTDTDYINGYHFMVLEDGRCIVHCHLGNKCYLVLGNPVKEIKNDEKRKELTDKELEKAKELEELKDLDREKYEKEQALRKLNDISDILDKLGLGEDKTEYFQLEDAKVIADSIVQLFERIFAAEGQYYFDFDINEN